MARTGIWLTDRVAAEHLHRCLGAELSLEQLGIVAEHLAAHRMSAFEMALQRMRSAVLDRVRQIVLAHHDYRGADWSEGCRSAEQAVLAITTADILGTVATPAPTKGQMLRRMIRRARREAAAETTVSA